VSCSRRPARAGNDGLWRVQVDYRVPTFGESRDPEPGGPAVASWSMVTETTPTDVYMENPEAGINARIDKPLTDLNGDFFDPPPTRKIRMGKLTLRWVSGDFNPVGFVALWDSLNASDFFGIPPLFGLLDDMQGQGRDDGQVTASIDILIGLTKNVPEQFAGESPHDLYLSDVNANRILRRPMHHHMDWSVLQVPIDQ